jgi:hypothetical protein
MSCKTFEQRGPQRTGTVPLTSWLRDGRRRSDRRSSTDCVADSTAVVQKVARWVRWGALSAAIVAGAAGCGGGGGNGIGAEATAQRNQAAALAVVQQSVIASAAVSSGTASENFEAGMADWQNWGFARVVAGAGTSGSQALQVGSGAGGAALKVPGVVAGTAYRLTAQVRVTNPAEHANMGIDFYNASGRLIGYVSPGVASTTFTKLTLDAVAPAGTTYALVWVWKNDGTGYAYVDDVSFGAASDAPPPPPAPPETNLVSNGGFEAGMTDWVDWGNTQVVPGDANSGASALRVGAAAGGAGHPVEGIVPDTTYRLVVHAKVSDPSEKVFVGVNFLNEAGALVTNMLLFTSSTSYTTLSSDVRAGPGAVRAVVYVWKNDGSGFGYVDDYAFGVAPGSAPPPNPPSANLLANGGFENGFASWDNWGNAGASTSQPAAGSSAAQVGTAAGGFGQYVRAIGAGSTYRLAAQVKVSTPDEIAYLGVKFLDASGNSLQDSLVPFSSTAYALAQVETVAPANATRALVFVWKNDGTGYAYVDEVAFTRVSEPAPGSSNIIQPGAFAPFGPTTLVSNFPRTTDRGLVSAARLTGGGSVVAWSTGTSVLVQRLDANGNAVGGAQTVGPVLTGDSAVITRLSAAATADGGWLIAWVGPDRSLAFQRYDASGAALGTAMPVDATVFAKVVSIQARAMADGSFVVAWIAAEGTSPTRAFLRRFNAAGAAVTDHVLVGDGAGAQTAVQITPLADGNFLAAWVQANPDGTDGMLARRLDAALNAAGPEQVLEAAAQYRPYGFLGFLGAASLSQGGTLFAWGFSDGSSIVQVRWQVLDASGTPTMAGPGSSDNMRIQRYIDSVEVIRSATGYRIVAESTTDTPRSTDAHTTVLDVGVGGELLGSSDTFRTLESVSPTTGIGCRGPYGSRPGVAAAGGEDGRYLLAYATCPVSTQPVYPNLEVVGR